MNVKEEPKTKLIFSYTGNTSHANVNGRFVQSNIKPNLGFEYDYIHLGTDINSVNLGFKSFNGINTELTKDEIKKVISYVNSIVIDDDLIKKHEERVELQRYLLETDYIENKYIRQVFRDKLISEKEFLEKYSDIINKRKSSIERLKVLTTELKL